MDLTEQKRKLQVVKDTFLKLEEVKDLESFIKVYRGFFTEFFKLRYQFTFPELVDEINKKRASPQIKKAIGELSDILSQFEYECPPLTDEDFSGLVKVFKEIVANLSPKAVKRKKEKKSFLKKVFGVFGKGKEEEEQEELVVESRILEEIRKNQEKKKVCPPVDKHLKDIQKFESKTSPIAPVKKKSETVPPEKPPTPQVKEMLGTIPPKKPQEPKKKAKIMENGNMDEAKQMMEYNLMQDVAKTNMKKKKKKEIK